MTVQFEGAARHESSRACEGGGEKFLPNGVAAQAQPVVTISPLLVPISDAARVLGVSRTTVYALLASGELRSVTINRRRLVVAESLREYVDRLISEGSTPPDDEVTT